MDSKVVYEEDNKKKGDNDSFVPFQGKAARWDGKPAVIQHGKEEQEVYNMKKHVI